MTLSCCYGCGKPILTRFLLTVLDKPWHVECVRCHHCHEQLDQKCFFRDGNIFCREDFYRLYGPQCAGCLEGISPSELVRKARGKVYHVKCFICQICRKQLSTGEELYILDRDKFLCKEDYFNLKNNQDLLFSDEEEELDDKLCITPITPLGSSCHESPLPPCSLPPPSPLPPSPANNNNNLLDTGILAKIKTEAEVEFGEYEKETADSTAEPDKLEQENTNPDETGGKRRGPRTTIKAKQLEVLKTAFSQTPKPTRHIREQLAKETGLPMRVIQVWFQNKRSKERRMKALAGRGGGFFMGGKRMRGFGLAPGLEDGRFGFYDGIGGSEFSYPGGRFGGDFYPGGPPPPNINFPPAGSQTSLEQPLPMSLPPLIPTQFSGGEPGYPPPPGPPGPQPPLSPDISPQPGGGGGYPGGEEGIGVW